MPRVPRVFVEGGIDHVYTRVTRGERVFADDGEAERLVDVMREVKQRDGLVVLAWCVMSNHYHLAVQCTSVPFIDELGRSTSPERPRLVKDLAAALGVRYDTASLWGRRGACRRRDDSGFGRQMDELDTALAATAPSRTVTGGEHGESSNV